jgi:hypothetical protein
MYHLPSFHFVSKKSLETENESLNDKEIFHFFRIKSSTFFGSNFTPAAWFAPVHNFYN